MSLWISLFVAMNSKINSMDNIGVSHFGLGFTIPLKLQCVGFLLSILLCRRWAGQSGQREQRDLISNLWLAASATLSSTTFINRSFPGLLITTTTELQLGTPMRLKRVKQPAGKRTSLCGLQANCIHRFGMTIM